MIFCSELLKNLEEIFPRYWQKLLDYVQLAVWTITRM